MVETAHANSVPDLYLSDACIYKVKTRYDNGRFHGFVLRTAMAENRILSVLNKGGWGRDWGQVEVLKLIV